MIDDTIFESFLDETNQANGWLPNRAERGRSRLAWRKTVREPEFSTEIEEFADRMREARDPAEIQIELLRLAMRTTRATRAELVLDGAPRRVLGRAEDPQPRTNIPACESISLVLRFGGRDLGELRLILASGHVCSEAVGRRLSTACTMAVSADRALRAERAAGYLPICGTIAEMPGPSFLPIYLQQAIQFARRRRESLSILCIHLDRAEMLGKLFGPKTVEEALRRVARVIVGALRSSDLVIQRDDQHLVAVLPDAPAHAALGVAETIGRAIRKSCQPVPEMPGLSVSIGLASYPDHAEHPDSLLAAAADALQQAQALGHQKVKTSTPPKEPSAA